MLKNNNRKQVKLIRTVKDENKILKSKLKEHECQDSKNSAIIQEQEELLEVERSVNNKLEVKIHNERKERLGMSSTLVLKATKKARKKIGAVIKHAKEEEENNIMHS